MNNLKFLQYYLGDQKDKSEVFCWKHAQMVAETLKKYLRDNKETPANIDTLERIALGHDLLEDTAVTEEAIVEQWGEDVLAGIKQLTNYKGDSDFTVYLKRLQSAPSFILLIKLADINTNVFNSVKCFDVLGKDWTTSFWLPLLYKYIDLYDQVEVTDFPQSAQALISDIKVGISQLENLVETA